MGFEGCISPVITSDLSVRPSLTFPSFSFSLLLFTHTIEFDHKHHVRWSRSHQSIPNVLFVILEGLVKLILQLLYQGTVFDLRVCIDGHAFAAIIRANREPQGQQFVAEKRIVVKRFDVGVADAA